MYRDIVVKKPWGHEYLVYENENVGLWLLRIESGMQTSMHSHPIKNTGLLVLDGEAQVSFLNDTFTVGPRKKLMIRRGLFHSTKAVSSNGIYMFEIETPRKKDDLVRLQDSYGRKATPYEGKSSHMPRSSEHLWLPDIIETNLTNLSTYFHNCLLKIVRAKKHNDLAFVTEEHNLMCLRGGLVNDNYDFVYQPGDVISGKTYNRLSKEFDFLDTSLILTVGE